MGNRQVDYVNANFARRSPVEFAGQRETIQSPRTHLQDPSPP